MSSSPEPHGWISPVQIWRFYQGAQEAFAALNSRLVANRVEPTSILFGLAFGDSQLLLRELRSELDREVTLALCACLESILRRDFEARVRKKLKDKVSRAFCELKNAKKPKRARFEDILGIWKKASGQSRRIGNLDALMRHRNWLAHGRLGVDKSGLRGSPDLAWRIGDEAIRAMWKSSLDSLGDS